MFTLNNNNRIYNILFYIICSFLWITLYTYSVYHSDTYYMLCCFYFPVDNFIFFLTQHIVPIFLTHTTSCMYPMFFFFKFSPIIFLTQYIVYIFLIHTTSCMCPIMPTHNILAIGFRVGETCDL